MFIDIKDFDKIAAGRKYFYILVSNELSPENLEELLAEGLNLKEYPEVLLYARPNLVDILLANGAKIVGDIVNPNTRKALILRGLIQCNLVDVLNMPATRADMWTTNEKDYELLQFLLLRFRLPANNEIITKYTKFSDYSRGIIGEDVVRTIMILNCVHDNPWASLSLEMIYTIFESLLWLQIPKFWI
jgi:hypothetical protein